MGLPSVSGCHADGAGRYEIGVRPLCFFIAHGYSSLRSGLRGRPRPGPVPVWRSHERLRTDAASRWFYHRSRGAMRTGRGDGADPCCSPLAALLRHSGESRNPFHIAMRQGPSGQVSSSRHHRPGPSFCCRRQWIPAFAGMTGEGWMAIGGDGCFLIARGCSSRSFFVPVGRSALRASCVLGPARAPSARTGSRGVESRAVKDRCCLSMVLASVSGCHADGPGRWG